MTDTRQSYRPTQLVDARRVPRRREPAPADLVPDGDAASRHEIRSIPLGPALGLAFRVAILSYGLWLVALGLFVLVCRAYGLVERFEDLVRSLGVRGFHVTAEPMFIALGVLGALWIVGMLAIALVAVASYNLASWHFGGLQLEISASSEPSRATNPGAPGP